jgi:hypothetical protein
LVADSHSILAWWRKHFFQLLKILNKKRTLFTSTLDLEIRKKLVKCYFWSIALYGAETWTLRAVDQENLVSLKCGAGEGWKRLVGLIM